MILDIHTVAGCCVAGVAPFVPELFAQIVTVLYEYVGAFIAGVVDEVAVLDEALVVEVEHTDRAAYVL